MGFFSKVFDALRQASQPIFRLQEKQLVFKISKEKSFSYALNAFKKNKQYDQAVLEAFTLSSEELFIEYIKLDSAATWNGLSRSLYESFFKDQLKLKNLELIKREEFGHYEFSTFLVNENFVLHLIFIWDVSTDIFIIDTKGELFEGLMKCFKEDYVYAFDKEEKGCVNFELSMVKNNPLKSFFGRYN